MTNAAKALKKQDTTVKAAPKPPGKIHMTALWVSALTALGSSGIPKIVELLDNKPSTAQVQTLIARRTNEIAERFNQEINNLQRLNLRVHFLEMQITLLLNTRNPAASDASPPKSSTTSSKPTAPAGTAGTAIAPPLSPTQPSTHNSAPATLIKLPKKIPMLDIRQLGGARHK